MRALSIFARSKKEKLALLFLLIGTFHITESHEFADKYYSFSRRRKAHTGVMVVAYNRVDYFKQVVDSLEKNPEAQSLPFFFFLDGGPKAKQKALITIIRKSKIHHKEIIARQRNLGCGRNISSARRFMFDWCGFDKVIYFEDDMVVSPEYIGLLKSLYAWGKSHYDNIGIVQCWYPCRLSLEQKIKAHDVVVETLTHFWGYLMDRQVWNDIRDVCVEYEKNYAQFHAKDDKKIRQWFSKIISSGKQRHFKKPFPLSPNMPSEESGNPASLFSKFYNNPEAGTDWDACTLLALWRCGYTKVSTLVNRGLSIGKTGVHFTQDFWEKLFRGVELHRFPEDRLIKNFRALRTLKDLEN